MSPRYPGVYFDYADCNWIIIATKPTWVVIPICKSTHEIVGWALID